ncbi:MAG: Protein YzbB [uncultured Solirubrobacteraceae bacterium]|uniref:Protein YzbB n=1 Tax=uncultured Solirubrobacteraceae bacterium TaxID=1162706 RepID=A0A6J4S8Z2_9ACTN|nr:MAG: Protein YzbB [uncultured Solirubrobacteraceae bacterium]
MRGALLRTFSILACFAAGCGGGNAPSSTVEADPLPASDRAVNAAPARASEAVVTIGLERLNGPEASVLKGKRVGLIANGASVTSDATPSAAALRAQGIRVVRLFAPEHGLSGRLAGGERVKGRADVVSLYEPGHRKPTRADLRGLDALVYDMQDAGVRFFTYISTMIYAQRAAAAAGVTFVVLDRPNPLGGEMVAGPVADLPDTILSVAPGPLVHGLTPGEMARLVRERSSPRGRLVVVPMEGWRRDMTWKDTGRRWVAPSPSLRSAQAALLYPGIALLEGTNASDGRGTGMAFRKLGAPWARVGRLLRAADVPGVEAVRSSFTPHPTPTGPRPKFNGQRCRGIALEVTGDGVDTFELGLRLLRALRSQPGFEWLLGGASIDTLLGTRRLRRALDRDASVAAIVASQRGGVAAWRRARKAFLLYD